MLKALQVLHHRAAAEVQEQSHTGQQLFMTGSLKAETWEALRAVVDSLEAALK